MSIRYSVVVPVYNEEAVIYNTYRRLKQIMEPIGESYELLFVNDGSRDRTAALLSSYSECDETVKLINFSRNFGHQIAMTAGMDYAAGDAVVIVDASRQDPLELIPEMIAKWEEGYDVVYIKQREQENALFKKQTNRFISRILQTSTEIVIPVEPSEFRLIDRKVCEELRQISDKNRFFRGMVSWVGFRQAAIEYEPVERPAGKVKYPLKTMLKLCVDVITSFSFKPLKLAGYLGGLLSVIGLFYAAAAAAFKLLSDTVIPIWHLLAVFQLFSSGFILIMIGILGEYIGRIYDETRGRPLYIVEDCRGVQKRASPYRGPVKQQACCHQDSQVH